MFLEIANLDLGRSHYVLVIKVCAVSECRIKKTKRFSSVYLFSLSNKTKKNRLGI